MGQPAARVTDMHVCPMVTVLVPHVGGPILPPGGLTVLIGGMPAARVGDMCVCVGPPDVIALGSFTVLIGGHAGGADGRHDGPRRSDRARPADGADRLTPMQSDTNGTCCRRNPVLTDTANLLWEVRIDVEELAVGRRAGGRRAGSRRHRRCARAG